MEGGKWSTVAKLRMRFKLKAERNDWEVNCNLTNLDIAITNGEIWFWASDVTYECTLSAFYEIMVLVHIDVFQGWTGCKRWTDCGYKPASVQLKKRKINSLWMRLLGKRSIWISTVFVKIIENTVFQNWVNEGDLVVEIDPGRIFYLNKCLPTYHRAGFLFTLHCLKFDN